MDLSGQLIKGTGSHEIKEIAPVPNTDIIDNGQFLNWTGDDPDDWVVLNENATNMVTQVTNGARYLWKAATPSNMTFTQSTCTIGKYYLFTIKVTDYVEGTIEFLDNDTVIIGYLTKNGIYQFIHKMPSIKFILKRDSLSDVDMVISEMTAVEVPEGYPLMDKGNKYLESTSSGTLAIPSKQAYGEWEVSFYKEGIGNSMAMYFCANSLDLSQNRYRISITSAEAAKLRYNTTDVIASDADYIENRTWYRFKITRTLDGEFYFYIKGGSFGVDDWVLVDVSGGTGTNPDTHASSILTCEYIILALDTGDRMANLTIKNLVAQ